MKHTKDNLSLVNIARTVLLLCALLCTGMVSAQVTGNQYATRYNNSSITTRSIQHKEAKWYDLRTQLGITSYDDDFDDTEDGLTETGMQRTHIVVDTIYMKRGTSTTLSIYDKNSGVSSGASSSSGNINNRTYQRWYNYETDGLFTVSISKNNGIIYDLLTPTEGSQSFYKFANGYVGKPLSSNYDFIYASFYLPTVAEGGESQYVVACDVSGYNDFTANYDITSTTTSSFTSSYYEPTLGHRYIYYIIPIDDADPVFHDMYITMPATRIPGNTNEMVALPMDARSIITNATADNNLTVTLGGTNTAGISLLNSNGREATSLTMSDDDRIIFFQYPNGNTDGTESVNTVTSGHPEATIVVSRGGTTLMNIYLTFKEESRLLSQSQLNVINTGTYTEDGLLSEFRHRDPDYLMSDLDLLTELNFDYDTSVSTAYENYGGQEQYYPFPLGWDDMSYGFYDGSVYMTSGFTAPSQDCPAWGYYGITNTYVESDSEAWPQSNNDGYADTPLDSETIRANSSGQQSTYHLFVDASDRAGKYARLPFEENLCGGTELYVTAWVKCATWTRSGTQDQAGAMFTIMGVDEDENGNETYIPIYRFQTGQIPYTYARTTTNRSITSEGYSTSRNDWMQVYFSFINESEVDYGRYVLEVENASASTIGADIYIDDIRIYVGHVNATISQLNASCTGDHTMMNVSFDYDRLIARIGVEEETAESGSYSGIDYCFIDKDAYDSYLEANAGDYAGAIASSVVSFSDGTNDENDTNYKYYNTVYFYNVFDENTLYNENDHPQLASANTSNGIDFLYSSEDENGVRSLLADFYASFTINKTYWIVIDQHTNNVEPSAATFAAIDLESACAIKTAFYVTSQTLLRVNGQVVDPETDYCLGQVLNFSAQVRVPTTTDETGLQQYVTVSDGIYFDWFFGTEEEYLNISHPNTTYDGMSLQVALTTFRDIVDFHDYDDMTGVTAGTYTGVDGNEVELTQAMIDIINYYLSQPDTYSGQTAQLVLHKTSLNLTILSETGLYVVVQPIPLQTAPDASLADYWQNVCWEYVPLDLEITGAAPVLRAGFSGVTYPSESFSPNLRIGIDQINNTSADNTFTVNLREVAFTSENITQMGVIEEEAYQKIFLVNTDDPAYQQYFAEGVGEFDEYSLPIGNIASLTATTDGGDANVATVYFDTTTEQSNGFKFTPREGYTYTFALHFQEYANSSSEDETVITCYGNFNVPMKVVPQYLVWQGTDATTNWNNDDNWKRADIADLKKIDGSYTSNATNTTDKGFVPMLFTNVVMPTDSKAQLYMGGFSEEGVWAEEKPNGMEDETEYIQYDLMAYEDASNKLSTQLYRVNLCDSIHFEEGAQMLHAEQLLSNNVSMDIPVVNNKWIAISAPLKNIVAGDWYTQTTGSQDTEYFKDITFTSDYSRTSPAIFQRSWSDAATIVGSTSNNVVSFTNNWSATYNDTSVPYYAGAGYSIRGWSSATSLLFRLPKADTSYDVSTGDIDRTNNGKLEISDMVDRSTTTNDASSASYLTGSPITVTLSAANGDDSYLMVGNPYMAPLDIQAFMAGNANLTQKYWYIGTDGNLQPVTYADGTWSESTTYIAPYSVFYVQAADATATTTDVYFTESMQAFETSDETATANVMTMTATSERATSIATLNYSTSASNSYDRLEDAELISGLGENDGPQLFTVADNTAISGNQVISQTRIPLGLYADDDETVTITFSNVAAIEDAGLYDAELATSTKLYDGYELQITGNSYGRYFLTGTGPGTTGINKVSTEAGVQVSSMIHRQVVVTSDTAIKEVSVWSASGALLGKASLNGDYTCTFNGMASGVALVKVTTDETTTTKKLIIR